jgi:hypothetical protein
MFDLAGTWNTSGTPTAFKLNITDTASASGSLLMDLQEGASSKFSVRKDGRVTSNSFIIANSGGFWSASDNGTITMGVSQDAWLRRDAANVIAMHNSTNAQAFRIYNTYTNSSNYERLNVGGTGGQFDIWTDFSGTGVTKPIRIYTSGSSSIQFGTAGNIRWNVSGAGHFLAEADNTYDIGAAAATRPRNLYMGSWIRMAVTTVASLPAAATAGAGARMMVSDALAPVFGSAVAGSGAVTVPVYSTGAAWNVG